ncbi:MAG: carboxypeptidase-like regulatory domain-containing protein [Terriglobales bacterium]
MNTSLSKLARLQIAMLAAWCMGSMASTAAQQTALQIQGGYRIAGTAISAATGGPLAGARIFIVDVNDRQNQDEQSQDQKNQRSIVTREDGRFAFTQVPAGKFSLTGSKRGFESGAYEQHEEYATAIVTGAGLDTENLTLRLQPSAVLSGAVLDETGEPVRGANVTLFRQDHNLGISRILRMGNDQTDDLGGYEFPNLAPGTYFVSASANPWYAVHTAKSTQDENATDFNVDPSLDVTYQTTYYEDATEPDGAMPIPLKGGDRVEVPLHLAPVPALHLRFHTTGGAQSGYQVPNLLRPTLDGNDFVQTDGAQMVSPNEWEISGVAAGKYVVRVPPQDPNTSNWSEMEADFTGNGEEMDASQAEPAGDVYAHVMMQDGGTVPDDLSIELLSQKGQPVAGVGINKQHVAELRSVPPGEYNLVAIGANKAYAVLQISIEGRPVAGRTIRVTTGSSIAATITTAASSVNVEGFAEKNGKPSAGVMVVLVPRHPESNRELFRRDQTDLDGSFLLHDVAPGEYTVVAIENGWELDWSEPAIIAYYAQHGQPVSLAAGKEGSQRLASRVEVQSK